MKYMGHKGRILSAIRGHIGRFVKDANALCDAFCGSAIVAWDLAQHFHKPVLAGDLQSFATARAAAVLTRTLPVTDFRFVDAWFDRAVTLLEGVVGKHRGPACPQVDCTSAQARAAVLSTRGYVKTSLARKLERARTHWPMTLSYGGYYFSLKQSMLLDALRATLPRQRQERAVAMSAVIGAASKCCAAPGHTAQPLGTNPASLPHVMKAWNRSVADFVRAEIEEVAARYAKTEGETALGSWEKLFDRLSPGDIAFCDPPYSAVQYSRFYHVLETLSRGRTVPVFGSGRNPPFEDRPESDFSRKSKAAQQVHALIRAAAEREVRLVITYPVSRQSNGLMAYTFIRAARKYYPRVEDEEVVSRFSSLGGNGENGMRPARTNMIERIICCSY
jgi:adenine-specific DNA-methyltransferase